MNELQFDYLSDYLDACEKLLKDGINFRGWQSGGHFHIELRGF